MTRQMTLTYLLIAGLLPIGAAMRAEPEAVRGSSEPRVPAMMMERHHYVIDAGVRPFLMFWFTSHDVGDAVVTRRRGPNQAGYSLLIGSDPERAPRGINRWGYIAEDIRGEEADLIGLMTQSDEQSPEEAEASLKLEHGQRTYEVMHATVDADRARSIVTKIGAPADYSLRQAGVVLNLARQASSRGSARDVRLPAGTRPGFLCALAEIMDRQVRALHAKADLTRDAAVTYVYHGRLYQLRARRADAVARLRVGAASYDRVIAAEYDIRNVETSEITAFSMTFGTDGPLAQVPIAAAYRPRWWMRIELAIDDTTAGPNVEDARRP